MVEILMLGLAVVNVVRIHTSYHSFLGSGTGSLTTRMRGVLQWLLSSYILQYYVLMYHNSLPKDEQHKLSTEGYK